ncbi:peptidase domain-containing ABC transporter [Saccharicrinis fermentans]|uniref:Alpha-hemolysin translocation ATP-binding protein HlyB n=1 Tax=Saccharicrinis fermentans DSM 9555 = JCM 21142 TaxID=869213 RepID=W7Y495_9BACT|nr:peptidase domain-containing ABC transporter [Saccharicrinis fermentans]GAF05700.1 alpha-hemolysin translocation ATP-binding protein HlyB [Saccharicrinis fermentans DSM 9555 = JCM 21142]
MNFPYYHQLDSNDCGPTCLQMVSKYYGKKISIEDIRKLVDVSSSGITLQDLCSAASKLKIDSEAVKINVKEMVLMPLPAILFWKQNHFVVLYKIDQKKKRYYIADPSFGLTKLNEEDFIRNWLGVSTTQNERGIVLLLEPQREFNRPDNTSNKIKPKNSILKYIYSIFANNTKSYIVALLLMGLALLMNWLIPTIFQRVIDDGIKKKHVNLVQILIFGQLACSVGYIIFITLYEFILLKVNFKLSINFLRSFLTKVTELPISFFLKRVSSDLLQRIQDLEILQRFLTNHAISFLITLANFIMFIVLLSNYNMAIASIYICSNILVFFWISFFFKKRKILDYNRFSVDSEYKNKYFELVTGMPDIKVNNASKIKINNLQSVLNKINSLQLKTLKTENYQTVGSDILDTIRNVCILGLCSYWVIENKLTLGQMLSINYILGQLGGTLRFFTNFSRDYQDAKISLDRLNDINNTSKELDRYNPDRQTQLSKNIIFKNVYFKYSTNNQDYILKNINLEIKKGTINAIVGESGSGKTTISKLLLGFYPPTKGNIFIDHHPISDINIDSWRSSCGVVLQEGYIFSGSFIENISMTSTSVDINKIKQAAKIACIDQFIESLPMEYNSIIGNNGICLSGGEKQRILIARAIYKNPKILILDEATNALDTRNEMEISKNFINYFYNKTVVIIAHRLSTIKQADNILVMKKGSVIEQGTHNDLLNNTQNHYYSLVKNQLQLEYTT